MLFLAALLGSLIFYLFYRYWLAWLLVLLVVLTPLFSLLVSLPAMLTARVRIQLTGKIRWKESAEAGMTIQCRFPGPLFRGKLLIQRPVTGEVWHRAGSMPLPTEHCGGLRLRVVSGYVYDYLGLFRFPVRGQKTRTLVVRPQPKAMAVPPDLNRYLTRSWRPRPGGGLGEEQELRLYRPGDNLRQIHWKLTAKTGDLIFRESQKPERRRAIVTVDISGTPDELDRKLGQLLWLGRYLLESGIPHEIWACTGNGIVCNPVCDEETLNRAMDALLWEPATKDGSILDRVIPAFWTCHVGGQSDEA